MVDVFKDEPSGTELMLPIWGSEGVLLVDARREAMRVKRAWPLLQRLAGEPKQAKPLTAQWETAKRGPLDRCFDAAMEVADALKLRYVEGLAMFAVDSGGKPELFPLMHGWCETEEGEIIDPTMWERQHENYLLYWGVGIQQTYHHVWNRFTGYFGCLDGDKRGREIGVYYDPPAMWLDPAKVKEPVCGQ